jgi:hypothetical protein
MKRHVVRDRSTPCCVIEFDRQRSTTLDRYQAQNIEVRGIRIGCIPAETGLSSLGDTPTATF